MQRSILLVALLAVPTASAESLGAAARRHRERRASGAARLLTNEDLARTTGRLANDLGTAPSDPAADTSAEADRPAEATPAKARVDLPVNSLPQSLERQWRAEGRRRRALVAELERLCLEEDRTEGARALRPT